MPQASHIHHLPPHHPAQRQRPKSPNRVLAEAEAQWLFTDAELANTPSVQDGMTPAEEQEVRAKGVNFIVQVGILLKLPQLTLSTAAIFFQRFLMRASLKKERDGVPKLHHYQTAATALFLATKVEESCRKMKELILAFCRVAQKNANLVIDEQSKDWWRWRDCILHNEDVLLETLCFDLTVESPHRQLFEMLKWYGVEHNKRLRNAAWGFVTDSNNTPLCLLCSSRTIAVAGLYAACRTGDVQLPDDAKGRPWWETQHVRLRDVRKAVEFMCANYEQAANKINGVSAAGAGGSEGEQSIYVRLSTPPGMDGAAADGWDSTRLLREDVQQDAPSPLLRPSSERRHSNASSVGVKREREEEKPLPPLPPLPPHPPAATNGERQVVPSINGASREDKENKRPRLSDPTDANGTAEIPPTDTNGSGDLKHHEEALRVENGNKQAEADVKAAAATAPGQAGEAEGSEEGEVEE